MVWQGVEPLENFCQVGNLINCEKQNQTSNSVYRIGLNGLDLHTWAYNLIAEKHGYPEIQFSFDYLNKSQFQHDEQFMNKYHAIIDYAIALIAAHNLRNDDDDDDDDDDDERFTKQIPNAICGIYQKLQQQEVTQKIYLSDVLPFATTIDSLSFTMNDCIYAIDDIIVDVSIKEENFLQIQKITLYQYKALKDIYNIIDSKIIRNNYNTYFTAQKRTVLTKALQKLNSLNPLMKHNNKLEFILGVPTFCFNTIYANQYFAELCQPDIRVTIESMLRSCNYYFINREKASKHFTYLPLEFQYLENDCKFEELPVNTHKMFYIPTFKQVSDQTEYLRIPFGQSIGSYPLCPIQKYVQYYKGTLSVIQQQQVLHFFYRIIHIQTSADIEASQNYHEQEPFNMQREHISVFNKLITAAKQKHREIQEKPKYKLNYYWFGNVILALSLLPEFEYLVPIVIKEFQSLTK
ncbi:Hypothetical_protein [Hexamita inflata]|uniref:Hypothetical_protein n=1 Tax=Hexamita inflata TaxID=28002 RepID=A0AA86Q191_9EUKA|nr:Hypothetical protein HINF_LOCUS37805 [Hexamita inflata]